MIKVLLVDDEILNIRYLKSIIDKIEGIEIIGTYTQPLQAIEFLKTNKVDIAFLDIELPDMNGIELALNLQNLQFGIEIVFVTAYSNYAIEAFNLHALHYLLKPIKNEQVVELVEHFKRIQIHTKNTSDSNNPKIIYFDFFKLINSLGEEVKWPTKKTAELCAYFLLHTGQKLPKYKIIEDLWSDIDEEKASQNFHITLYRLRNIISNEKLTIKIEAIRGSNEGYICISNRIKSDLDEFTEIFNANESVNMDDVYVFFKTINGGFLEHNYYAWSEHYQNEVQTQIINRTHQWIREIESENRDKAIEIVHTVLKIYNTDESLMMHYFNLLMRKGEKYQILHEFEKYKRLLKLEYNIDPSREINEFVKKIIR